VALLCTLAACAGSPPPDAARVRCLVMLPFVGVQGRVATESVELVAARVLAELAELEGYRVISPVEVRMALLGPQSIDAPLEALDASGRARLVGAFAPDALLFGRVRRFQERDERGLGRSAVAFDLRLEAPDGSRLWSGSYAEEQRGLLEDLRSLVRAWSVGFRSVPPERLAAEGARALVSELVGAPGLRGRSEEER